MQNHWRSADKRFKTVFEANPFGLSCSVCDRLWFERDLKKVKHRNISFLHTKFPDENVTEFRLCSTCSKSIDAKKIPTLSRSNGFRYPPKPSGLPLLEPISIRLISPRLPFMQIRRLRYEVYGIVGQVINVPVNVNNMVQQLPRRIDDDFAFNVNIKKKLIHKSNYLSGFVRKSVIKAWLRYLVNQPLYKHYDIKIDWSVFYKDMDDYIGLEFQIESVDPDFAPESEILLARQHTLLWNEEQCLDIAPGQNSSPINIIYDVHGEELSFPQIYYGVPRQFDLNVRVTPYMMATSEIRRTDRRGATPDHVLYMAMKMLRIRVVEVDTELHSILDDSQKRPICNVAPACTKGRETRSVGQCCGNRSTTIHSNRSRAWCKVNVPATVHLFHRNHDVHAYNNNVFIPEFENFADDKMIGYNTLTEVATARRNLHKMSVVESGGLPYSLKLAVGYPYMITMNLDVEDGLVNGAIGTLKYIEYLTEDEQVTVHGTTEVDVEPQPSTSTRIRKRVRLWLEFPNPSMGQLCRVKAKPHVMCKRDVLDLKWTPIVTRAANIPLGGNIKCRRNQFPVVSASAITIHKSQGGTFDEVVFNYDKSQQIQLVYVALSRVTSIDGLYLTNDKDDFKFYHRRGSTAPTVKDIRDEYDRMANHRLPTLSMQARAFCKRDVLAERNEDQGGYLHRRRQLILIVSAFNAQSLVAHAGDIESDNILMNSDYMVISETWMNCANTVMINGFELRANNNTALEHRTHCPSTSSELPVRVSAAGGSAIYRNLQSSTNCSEIIVNANKSWGNSVLRKHNVGDICLVDVKVEDLTLFILGAVYIHPKASAEAVKLCLYQSLLPYSAKT
ncbi:uncharacterized protein TNCV_619911 [Trichonephila clavipes]|nr:uncharacterized protein TNCV_619911 [Trichonephila clavipes]